jgi:hypothetical protein
MIIRFIKLTICFILFTASQSYADTVYTWTDAAGVIHISASKPPETARQPSRFAYAPARQPDMKDAAASPAEKQKESLWLSTLEQARLERKNADKARQLAENAIQAANLSKKETDEFLEPWRNKNRVKKELLRQIEHRIQTTHKAIEQAETLIQLANEAEQTAQNAEREAKRVERELFEEYRKIMSN